MNQLNEISISHVVSKLKLTDTEFQTVQLLFQMTRGVFLPILGIVSPSQLVSADHFWKFACDARAVVHILCKNTGTDGREVWHLPLDRFCNCCRFRWQEECSWAMSPLQLVSSVSCLFPTTNTGTDRYRSVATTMGARAVRHLMVIIHFFELNFSL